jgi:hypothetical protein
MSNNVSRSTTISAYDELITANLSPIVQVSAKYATFKNIFVITGSSGAATSDNSLFRATSGAAAGGLGVIFTNRQIQSRAGVGCVVRLDAMFGTPSANNRQRAGFQNSEDGAVFAYEGLDFGVVHYYNGKAETQILTVTTGASSGGNAIVTISATPYLIPLTAGSALHTATEIVAVLTILIAQVAYTFSANETDGVVTVVAQSNFSGPAGPFAYSAGSTGSVAAWSSIVTGAQPNTTFIAMSNWNGSFDTTSFDPLKLNYYQVQFNGSIHFKIFDPIQGVYVDAHVIDVANNSILPLFSNPTFRAGWGSQNFGSTVGSTISGQQLGMFEEGEVSIPDNPVSASAENPSIGTSPTCLIAIRNRYNFGNRFNRANIKLSSLEISTETAKIGIFDIYLNPTFSQDMSFRYVDEETSITEISNTVATVSGGTIVGSFICKDVNPRTITSNLTIYPGNTLAICARVSANPAAQCFASVTGVEDY